MWNRGVGPANATVSADSGRPEPQPFRPPQALQEAPVLHLGSSVKIKGELSGSEDLTLEGEVDGKVGLPDHTLIIGPKGRVRADVMAKVVVIGGSVEGNVTAAEKIEVQAGGVVRGDLRSPRLVIADGAFLAGAVHMERANDGAAVAAPRIVGAHGARPDLTPPVPAPGDPGRPRGEARVN